MKRNNFGDGEVIFRAGDRSDAAYLLISGQVEIVQAGADGRSETLAVLEQGEYFGEMGAIEDRPRSATAIAKGPVVCMSVGQKEFLESLLKQPEEAIGLLKILFERLRKANERLAHLEKTGAQ